MHLGNHVVRFSRSDCGAANKDWLLIVAAMCGMALVLFGANGADEGEGDSTFRSAAMVSLAGGFRAPTDACPTIRAEASVTRWTTDAVCNAAGNFCHPEVRHTFAIYTMRDGSRWTAQIQQAEGERPYARWFDADGTEVPPPCPAP